MTDIITERVCADPEGDITVFIIGMRINRFWKVWRWVPVVLEMPKMLQELGANPDIGLLHSRALMGIRNLAILQYWKSAEHLTAYAHAHGRAHLPAWQSFNAKVGTSGDVGIWHETYVVPRGSAESIFVNMPRYGLGLASDVFPAKGARATASKRLGLTKGRAEPSES